MKNLSQPINHCVNPQETLLDQIITRETCGYKDLSDKLRHKKKDFSIRYTHIYTKRLLQMKDILTTRAREKWGDELPIKRLAELEEGASDKCVIIGTLLKDQELRPNILKEISEKLEIVPQKKMVRFVSETDKVILEDELQRIVLLGNIDAENLVTGVVCAVLGAEETSGKFTVEDICYPGPQKPSPFLKQPRSTDKYALFLSGLDLAQATGSLPSVQLLVHWLSGWIGSEQETISFVLIAGGLISSGYDEKEEATTGSLLVASDAVSGIQLADSFLAELSASLNVELMPNKNDPTNYLLPQQPLHYMLFPTAMNNKTFNGSPNPHKFQLENLLIIGSSGEPVADIGCYSGITEPLEALEATFHWGHIAPTAPDSLGCYPFYEEDPFVMEEQPDILFSSNHEKFQTKLVEFDHGEGVNQKTRLICIPSFSKTLSCVLVNLSNLDTQVVSFDA